MRKSQPKTPSYIISCLEVQYESKAFCTNRYKFLRFRIHNQPQQSGILPVQELFCDEKSCSFLPWAFQHIYNSRNHKISLVLLQACDDIKGAGAEMARWRVKISRVETDQNGFGS